MGIGSREPFPPLEDFHSGLAITLIVIGRVTRRECGCPEGPQGFMSISPVDTLSFRTSLLGDSKLPITIFDHDVADSGFID